MCSRLWAAAAAILAGVLLSAQAPAPVSPGQPSSAIHAIVIDPGHGGDDFGVKMSDDIVEKQLTLDIARRIKTQAESRLGVRVVLTRDDDRTVSADERAAIANNSKAGLFLSLHFNAALVPSASGAQVYYQALDREGEEALKTSEAEAVKVPGTGGTVRAIDLIRWDMAQARHIEQSAALAGILGEQLRAHVPMAARPIHQAPMRALVGVDMPAALIELAYLTNPTQAKDVSSADFQASIAQVVSDAVVQFRGPAEGGR